MSSVEYAAVARLFTKKGLKLSAEEVRAIFKSAALRRAGGEAGPMASSEERNRAKRRHF